ncbi:MAG: adenylate/guanylate cyclase domain-containing protein [Betaproteobacteria bacterium]
MSQRRKLAAILSADVVGYSRLMAANEAATVETLKSYRDIITRLVVRHGGRVVDAPGDALLAEFPSAVEAVQAAVDVQKSLEGHNIELEPERRMQFRIGVNLGDVIEEPDGKLYGDGLNIAARMEAWLAQADEPQELEVLRRNADKGLPCGSERFIRKLEKLTGRGLQYRPQGRPRKENNKG